MHRIRYFLLLFFKGIGVGAANVIPGVSGGTIAFITNIYEELIDSLKSLDFKAVRLLFTFRVMELSRHINLPFLIVLFAGVFISIISLGKILDFLFHHYPIHVWAYFFGLILASVFFVGKKIDTWNFASVIMLIIGTAIAVSISFLRPASENANFIYLTICGIVAMSSMLLPGLSGSFVLILLGNYQLIFLQAVPEFQVDVLIPIAIGCIIGLVALSHFISYILKKFRDGTIALLTGFILGSLLIIWPWKDEIYLKDQLGNFVIKDGEKVIQNYERYMPDLSLMSNIIAVVMIIIGIISVWLIERMGEKKAS